MSTLISKPKRRWFQFTLRKFVLLVTLFSVLAVGFWRYREWGRRLRDKRAAEFYTHLGGEHWIYCDDPQGEMIYVVNGLREVDRKHWLQLKVYELTSRHHEPWEVSATSANVNSIR